MVGWGGRVQVQSQESSYTFNCSFWNCNSVPGSRVIWMLAELEIPFLDLPSLGSSFTFQWWLLTLTLFSRSSVQKECEIRAIVLLASQGTAFSMFWTNTTRQTALFIHPPTQLLQNLPAFLSLCTAVCFFLLLYFYISS